MNRALCLLLLITAWIAGGVPIAAEARVARLTTTITAFVPAAPEIKVPENNKQTKTVQGLSRAAEHTRMTRPAVSEHLHGGIYGNPVYSLVDAL